MATRIIIQLLYESLTIHHTNILVSIINISIKLFLNVILSFDVICCYSGICLLCLYFTDISETLVNIKRESAALFGEEPTKITSSVY